MGEILADEAPVDADLVISVPDSGNAAANGFARAARLPKDDGLIKNRYVARTFIQPGQELRKHGLRMKFNPLPEIVSGKRVVVVDDSIVRGNTTRQIIGMLRDAGATEVHLRISAPPIRHPCHYGVDMSTREEMIAHGRSVAEIAEELGADSLAYLSLDGVYEAVGTPREVHCDACFTGDYPLGDDGEETGSSRSSSCPWPLGDPSPGRSLRRRSVDPLSLDRPRSHRRAPASLRPRRFQAGQAEAVAAAVAGRDVLLVMPTGAGKSVCYQLPALMGDALTVVVSPLVSLMQDQVEGLGDQAALINAQRDPADNRRTLVRALAGEVRMLYVAPERFASPGFLDRLRAADIGLFVVDEAHCVSQWGHDFRPEYFRLGEVARALGARSLFAATATATPRVAGDVQRRLGLRDPVRITTGFDRPNLSYDVVAVGSARAKREATLALLAEPGALPAIVYAGTRKKTEETAAALARALGRPVPAYHAGMEREPRADAQRAFMSGTAPVVVATNAFGMGVDKADVRTVIHETVPASLEAYYQEAGRAATGCRRVACCWPKSATRACTSSSSTRSTIPRPSATAGASTERSGGSWRASAAGAAILRHFGDRSAPEALGRCCDLCDRAAPLVRRRTPAVSPARSARAGPTERASSRRSSRSSPPRSRAWAARARWRSSAAGAARWCASTATTSFRATGTSTTGARTTSCGKSTR